MCVDPGCTPQHVCLEDIKLLLGDDDKIETLCTRALMQHVNQNPDLGRCPTVDCKQVWCVSRCPTQVHCGLQAAVVCRWLEIGGVTLSSFQGQQTLLLALSAQ